MNRAEMPWWAADFLRAADFRRPASLPRPAGSRSGAAAGNGSRNDAADGAGAPPRGSVSIIPGAATALVEGRGFRPSRVVVRAPVLDHRRWEAFVGVVAGQALHTAALLAGYLPRSARDDLARVGVRLVPPRSRLSIEPPDCPPDTVSGTARLVARHFAADPFQLLRFRGADQRAVLAAIARRWKASLGDGRPVIPLEELEGILARPPEPAAGSLLPAVQRAEAFRNDPVLRANLARLYRKVAERAAAATPGRTPPPAPPHRPAAGNA